MKHISLIKTLSAIVAIAFFSFTSYSQIKTAIIYADDDVTLGNGTAAGDFSNSNFGASPNISLCNFDDNEKLMSYYEGWIKFDLSTIEDSIPEGEKILYAELSLLISGNTGNGFHAYHLYDADDWEEGTGSGNDGLTYNQAQVYDYTNPDKYNLLYTANEVGEGMDTEDFNIIPAIEKELGETGNKTLTIRLEPTITDYIKDDPDLGKKWLGFNSRQATNWGPVIEYNREEIAVRSPHITFYIGPEQETIFSDNEGFNNIEEYTSFPKGFGKWIVAEDEGDLRYILTERGSPINKTPGAVSVASSDFEDFSISMDAKAVSDDEIVLDTKYDLIMVFGYIDAKNYSYMMFSATDESAFYNVADGEKTLIGEEVANQAILDKDYHTYKITRTGSTLTAFIDDAQYHTVTDDALALKGKVGMGSYNDLAIFDNFIQGESTVNLESLNDVIDLAESEIGNAKIGTEDGQYSQDAVDVLSAAIIVAKEIAKNTESKQSDINGAIQSLTDAIDAFLKSVNGVYIADLEAAINSANEKIKDAIEGTEGGQFKPGAKSTFQSAINAAQQVLSDTEATQESVNSALDALKAADLAFEEQIINVGIHNINSSAVSLYPVPVQNMLEIKADFQIKQIVVTNIFGQNIKSIEASRSTNISVDLSDLSSGIYLVNILDANNLSVSVIKKIFKN